MKGKKNTSKNICDDIVEAMEEVIEDPSSLLTYKISINIKNLRKSLNMTQKEFAEHYGFSLETLKKWEQGLYEPDKAVTSYLTCISESPQTIKEILKKRKF